MNELQMYTKDVFWLDTLTHGTCMFSLQALMGFNFLIAW